MAGFTAINIGMRIPGMLGKLKDGVLGLVRSASHLFNLTTGILPFFIIIIVIQYHSHLDSCFFRGAPLR